MSTTEAHVQTFLFWHLVKESRPVVLTLAGLRFVAGVLISTDAPPGLDVAVACLAWILVTAGIYLTNASSDVLADIVNHKRRPLARGLITRGQVNAGAACAFAAAMFIGSLFGPAFLIVVASMGTIGVLYSIGPRPGKSHFLSTGLIVATGIFLPYVGGSLAAHGEIRPPALIGGIVCGCWAGVASLSKDFADLAGDKASGRITLPVLLGLRKASRIAAGGSTAIALLALFFTFVPGLKGLWVLWFGTCAFAAACVALSRSQNAPFSLGTPYRIFMMTQLSTNSAMIATATAALIFVTP